MLMGGIHYIDYKNDVWRSTDDGATWTEINRSAGWSARGHFNSVVMPDGSIGLIGGMSSGGTSVLYDVWRFAPAGSSIHNPYIVILPQVSIRCRCRHTILADTTARKRLIISWSIMRALIPVGISLPQSFPIQPPPPRGKP